MFRDPSRLDYSMVIDGGYVSKLGRQENEADSGDTHCLVDSRCHFSTGLSGHRQRITVAVHLAAKYLQGYSMRPESPSPARGVPGHE